MAWEKILSEQAVTSGSVTLSNMSKLGKYAFKEHEDLPIGGRIFYIHDDNGAEYHFYDANGLEITTQTVEGLADAVTYKVIGTPTKDKFYVFDNQTHSINDGVTTYRANNGLVSSIRWGYCETATGATGEGIGDGKLNTLTVLNIEDTYTNTA